MKQIAAIRLWGQFSQHLIGTFLVTRFEFFHQGTSLF
jgi:hypothetical protein